MGRRRRPRAKGGAGQAPPLLLTSFAAARATSPAIRRAAARRQTALRRLRQPRRSRPPQTLAGQIPWDRNDDLNQREGPDLMDALVPVQAATSSREPAPPAAAYLLDADSEGVVRRCFTDLGYIDGRIV